MPRSLIVTGCDANHYDLVADLVASLRDARGSRVEIGFVHVGEDPVPPSIANHVDHIAEVPDRDFEAKPRRGFRLAYLSVKARLPEFFPGYEVYVWLDGDTWVQNPVGLDEIAYCAGLADVCMHPERDVNYMLADPSRNYLYDVYRRIYGEEEANRYNLHASINSGVFGATASSPLWKLWRDALADVRDRGNDSAEVHFSDQIPVHRLIVSGRLSWLPLRSVNNWLTMLCRPAIHLQRRRLVVPTYPNEEINIIHLIHDTKDATFGLGEGGRQITLRYRDIKALFADADAQVTLARVADSGRSDPNAR
ncbi:MAG TPA: hypothetical protein VKT30_06985 [Caulobacteraceae bacterium]|nr:hypothetical protein [Caulobacteraceae bacterium]